MQKQNIEQIFEIKTELGNIFFSLGEYDKALKYQREAHDDINTLLGKNNIYIVKILNNIGTIFLKIKEIDKAEEYFL